MIETRSSEKCNNPNFNNRRGAWKKKIAGAMAGTVTWEAESSALRSAPYPYPSRCRSGKYDGVKERIQKLLANAGVDSRRNVEQMVLEGRVAVNGRTIRELPVLVDPDKDEVEVAGERVRLRDRTSVGRRHYIVMNKPKGVYSTN